MNVQHWRPLGRLMNMQDRLNRFFDDDFFKDFGFGGGMDNASLSRWSPAADVYETKDDYIVKMDIPGIDKEDIDIQFHDGTLTIKGERKLENDVKEDDYHRMERFSGSFTRSFSFPGDTDGSKINASMKEGILELRIPRAEEKKARSIPINLDN